jgi:hypothetical protein
MIVCLGRWADSARRSPGGAFGGGGSPRRIGRGMITSNPRGPRLHQQPDSTANSLDTNWILDAFTPDGQITEYPLPAQDVDASPGGIAADGDRTIWVVMNSGFAGAGKGYTAIEQVSTSGQATQHILPQVRVPVSKGMRTRMVAQRSMTPRSDKSFCASPHRDSSPASRHFHRAGTVTRTRSPPLPEAHYSSPLAS